MHHVFVSTEINLGITQICRFGFFGKILKPPLIPDNLLKNGKNLFLINTRFYVYGSQIFLKYANFAAALFYINLYTLLKLK